LRAQKSKIRRRRLVSEHWQKSLHAVSMEQKPVQKINNQALGRINGALGIIQLLRLFSLWPFVLVCVYPKHAGMRVNLQFIRFDTAINIVSASERSFEAFKCTTYLR
jgi:hypothetical protein